MAVTSWAADDTPPAVRNLPQPNTVPAAGPKEAVPPPSVTIIGARDAHGVLGREVRSPTDEDMGRIAPMGCTRLILSKPVIAAVSGYAVAGGMELALWADMRVVAEDATFGIFCRRFGVPLIDLGTIRLPRLIGHSQAIDLILTGRPVGAQEALRMGLANRVVGRGEACAHAIALAREIARFPQKCLRADRLSALRQWDLSEEEAISNEMRGGLKVIASGETLSGATRFASGIGRHGAFGSETGTD